MPGRPAPFTPLARQIGPTALEGFKDEGLVRLDDSAQLLGLSAAGAPRKRWRQRNAAVGRTPQSSAVLARLLPSIIARAWSSQRSLLCRCAIAVLVSALKVRPQLLQRNRESPCEPPQATIARPAQCGQPWLATRSWPLVPKASGRQPRFAPLSLAPPAAEASVSPATPSPPPQARHPDAPRRRPGAQPPNPRKPNGKLIGLHRIKLLKPRPTLIQSTGIAISANKLFTNNRTSCYTHVTGESTHMQFQTQRRVIPTIGEHERKNK